MAVSSAWSSSPDPCQHRTMPKVPGAWNKQGWPLYPNRKEGKDGWIIQKFLTAFPKPVISELLYHNIQKLAYGLIPIMPQVRHKLFGNPHRLFRFRIPCLCSWENHLPWDLERQVPTLATLLFAPSVPKNMGHPCHLLEHILYEEWEASFLKTVVRVFITSFQAIHCFQL